MPHLQATPRKDSARSASVARRLVAAVTVASGILSQVFVLSQGDNEPVIKMYAVSPFLKGTVVVKARQQFYLVESDKFSRHYYVVASVNGHLRASCAPQLAASLYKKINAYRRKPHKGEEKEVLHAA